MSPSMHMGSTGCTDSFVSKSTSDTMGSTGSTSTCQLRPLRMQMVHTFVELEQLTLPRSAKELLDATLQARQALCVLGEHLYALRDPLPGLHALQEEACELRDTLRELRGEEREVDGELLAYVAGARRELMAMLEQCAVTVMEAEEWVEAQPSVKALDIMVEANEVQVAGRRLMVGQGAEVRAAMEQMLPKALELSHELDAQAWREDSATCGQLQAATRDLHELVGEMEAAVQESELPAEATERLSQLEQELLSHQQKVAVLATKAQGTDVRSQAKAVEDQLMEMLNDALMLTRWDCGMRLDDLLDGCSNLLDKVLELNPIQKTWSSHTEEMVILAQSHTEDMSTSSCDPILFDVDLLEDLQQDVVLSHAWAMELLSNMEQQARLPGLDTAEEQSLAHEADQLAMHVLDLSEILDQIPHKGLNDWHAELAAMAADILDLAPQPEVFLEADNETVEIEQDRASVSMQLGMAFAEAAELCEAVQEIEQQLVEAGLLKRSNPSEMVDTLVQQLGRLLARQAGLSAELVMRMQPLLAGEAARMVKDTCRQAMESLASALDSCTATLENCLESNDLSKGFEETAQQLLEPIEDATRQLAQLGVQAEAVRSLLQKPGFLGTLESRMTDLQRRLSEQVAKVEQLDDLLMELHAARTEANVTVPTLQRCDQEMRTCLGCANELNTCFEQLRCEINAELADQEAAAIATDLLLDIAETRLQLQRLNRSIVSGVSQQLVEHASCLISERAFHLDDVLHALQHDVSLPVVEEDMQVLLMEVGEFAANMMETAASAAPVPAVSEVTKILHRLSVLEDAVEEVTERVTKAENTHPHMPAAVQSRLVAEVEQAMQELVDLSFDVDEAEQRLAEACKATKPSPQLRSLCEQEGSRGLRLVADASELALRVHAEMLGLSEARDAQVLCCELLDALRHGVSDADCKQLATLLLVHLHELAARGAPVQPLLAALQPVEAALPTWRLSMEEQHVVREAVRDALSNSGLTLGTKQHLQMLAGQ